MYFVSLQFLTLVNLLPLYLVPLVEKDLSRFYFILNTEYIIWENKLKTECDKESRIGAV